MSFKEQVAADVKGVFINSEEFADEHKLNGTTCQAVVQSPTSKERFISGMTYNRYEGISGELIIVHCDKSDLPEVPVEGQVFTLDDVPCLVSSCIDDMGVLTIELHAHER